MKLCALPKSTKMKTFCFLMYPTIFKVWGDVIPAKVCNEIMVVSSSSFSIGGSFFGYSSSLPSRVSFRMNSFFSGHLWSFDHLPLHQKHNPLALFSYHSLMEILLVGNADRLFNAPSTTLALIYLASLIVVANL